MCDDKYPFVLDKKYLVKRGKNVDLSVFPVGDPGDVRVCKALDELADSRPLEGHTISDTISFPDCPHT